MPTRSRSAKPAHAFSVAKVRSQKYMRGAKLEKAGSRAFHATLKKTGNLAQALGSMEQVARDARPPKASGSGARSAQAIPRQRGLKSRAKKRRIATRRQVVIDGVGFIAIRDQDESGYAVFQQGVRLPVLHMSGKLPGTANALRKVILRELDFEAPSSSRRASPRRASRSQSAEAEVTAADIIPSAGTRSAATRNLRAVQPNLKQLVSATRRGGGRLWMCSGKARRGCGGGKPGGHVVGHFL